MLSTRKSLTRDVLESRGKHLDDNTCLFCSERETSQHLFFDCVVAKQVWTSISELLGLEIGSDFESVGSKWLCNKKFLVHNMISSAALWSIWKLRNNIHFQNSRWRDLGSLLLRITRTIQNWIILSPGQFEGQVNSFGERAKENSVQTWETYWLKRGVSPSSMADWRTSNYNWDMKYLPEDLKRICESEMLSF
ncbi:hypothetical protein C2845_PM03G35150 [Panicum miliaceum]|uniref:Reverse transcriptase zinc-binding domain-containing protein n=1 Tax=Panicum miliaceum TaxID=4540 RepID=A0A3L6TFB0_PANMI|nr:hypothetical protein C2845_PM03G35150 [Panicum miliaceum]